VFQAKAVKQQKPTALSIILNVFMISSALVLTFFVLVAEERYAFGPVHDDSVTVEQSVSEGLMR
jgi:hypothetical protein